MKLKEFKKPILEGEFGNYSFKLYNGMQTKKFISLGKFDTSLGVYEICDCQGNVIEYMDIMGNFSKKPSDFANHFNNYIETKYLGINYSTPPSCLYYTWLIDFPSKYLINKNVRKIIKNEEVERYNRACKNGTFCRLLDKLRYKIYIDKVFNQKLARAKDTEKKLTLNKGKTINVEDYVLTL